ncbi:MAG: SAM-dependent methyltransferase [Acidobacteria bacterium]|nr:SAM-dependent methyltransferase [Acidobacteriota bacterium]
MNGRETDRRNSSTLAARLRERIRREGALTFRDWMEAALYDERDGYYRSRDLTRWGRAGDYRTSSERSALFASTLARYFAALYEELGRPRTLHVAEAGGGAGHFAHGLLSALRRDSPHISAALRYVFDDISPDARARAEALLAPFGGSIEFRRIGEIETPLEAAIVFSNELFDAFPIHRVRARGGALFEQYVDVDEGGGFVWTEREPSTLQLSAHFARLGIVLSEGQLAEVNLDAEEWIERLAPLVGEGFVVTVDYGDEAANLYGDPRRREGTLRAFKGHTLSDDVLASPGSQDLTTTVNWTQLRETGERAGLRAVLLERQDRFLLRAGLLEQLEHECALAADEAEVARLRLDAREMILPGGMAEHFQVMVQKKKV